MTLDAPIEVLRAAAAKNSRTVDIAGANLEIAAALARFEAADFYALNRADQIKLRAAKRKAAPLLRDLTRVLIRLKGIGGENWRDLLGHREDWNPAELARVVQAAESALRDTIDADGKDGRPAEFALRNLILPLADIYKKHTGRPAAASSSRGGGDKRGPFVEFVRAVAKSGKVPLPAGKLGGVIANMIEQDRSHL